VAFFDDAIYASAKHVHYRKLLKAL